MMPTTKAQRHKEVHQFPGLNTGFSPPHHPLQNFASFAYSAVMFFVRESGQR